MEGTSQHGEPMMVDVEDEEESNSEQDSDNHNNNGIVPSTESYEEEEEHSRPPYQPDERVFCKDVHNSSTNDHTNDDTQMRAATTTMDRDNTSTTGDELFYEAIIRKVRDNNHRGRGRKSNTNHPNNSPKSRWSFLIHYSGWNARWDKWVPLDKLLPDTKENRQRYEEQKRKQQQQQIQQQREKDYLENLQQQSRKRKKYTTANNHTTTNAATNSATSTSSTTNNDENYYASTTATTNSNKGGPGSTSGGGTYNSTHSNNSKANLLAYLEEICDLPFTLKTVLVEEWEKINRRGFDSPFGYDSCYDDNFHCSSSRSNSSASSNSSSNSDSDRDDEENNYLPVARTVHNLPSSVTIRKLLHHFEKTQKKRQQQQQQQSSTNANYTANNTSATTSSQIPHISPNQIHNFCQGLESLFEEALPVCLLYPQERGQYNSIIQNINSTNNDDNNNNGDTFSQRRLSEIYGCEFLLRLFVRLPMLLKNEIMTNDKWWSRFSTNDDDDGDNDGTDSGSNAYCHYVPYMINELIVLLQKNRQGCFKGNYRPPKINELLPFEKKKMSKNTKKKNKTQGEKGCIQHQQQNENDNNSNTMIIES